MRRQILRDFFLRPAGLHAVREGFDIVIFVGKLVALLDQQPFVAFAAALHQDKRKLAFHLLAVGAKLQIAPRQLTLAIAVFQHFERPVSQSITLPAP